MVSSVGEVETLLCHVPLLVQNNNEQIYQCKGSDGAYKGYIPVV